MTLKDIADGMAHLHSKNILHCDLNGKQPSILTLRLIPFAFAATAVSRTLRSGV